MNNYVFCQISSNCPSNSIYLALLLIPSYMVVSRDGPIIECLWLKELKALLCMCFEALSSDIAQQAVLEPIHPFLVARLLTSCYLVEYFSRVLLLLLLLLLLCSLTLVHPNYMLTDENGEMN